MLVDRKHDRKSLRQLIEQFPITLLTGPRQCGKTTLAKSLEPSRYFFLSSFSEAEEFLGLCKTQPKISGLICVDEIQDKPEALPLIRQWVDTRKDIKLLLLGSAIFMLEASLPRYLLGRMATYSLGGFTLDDVGVANVQRLWTRGGFPLSYLAENDELSYTWRQEYIASYPHAVMLRETTGASPHLLGPLIQSIAQYSSGILNYSNVSRAIGVSRPTVQRYFQLLEASGLIRLVSPLAKSTGATIRKNPKLYMRDSGLLACLSGLGTEKKLVGNEDASLIWEAYVLENLSAALQHRRTEIRYWRDRTGAEIDAVWEEDGLLVGAEIKYSAHPSITKSMKVATEKLALSHLWVLHRGHDTYSLADQVTAAPFTSLVVPQNSAPEPVVRRPQSYGSLQPAKRVFVSYSHDDEAFVQKLVEALEAEQINVIVDYKTLRLGGSIEEFIRKAVKGTERTILVVSENSIRSAWVMAEFLETVLYENFTSRSRLIPIYLDTTIFDANLPIDVDKELSAKIAEVDVRIRTALDRRMDLEPFVGVRDRLRNLQFNVGKAIQRLTSVLSGDFSDSVEFQKALGDLIAAIDTEED